MREGFRVLHLKWAPCYCQLLQNSLFCQKLRHEKHFNGQEAILRFCLCKTERSQNKLQISVSIMVILFVSRLFLTHRGHCVL